MKQIIVIGATLFCVIIGATYIFGASTMQIKTFKLHKIVRDKIVDILRPRSVSMDTRELSHEEKIQHLKYKLIEEAQEALNAKDKTELIEELADVLEVVHALVRESHVSLDELEAIRAAKCEKKGGFEKCMFIEKITYSSDEYFYHYCLANQDKYPEIMEEHV